MKITDFRNINRFPHCAYRIDVSWTYLEFQIKSDVEIGLDLDPDFQRAHVWTEEQQIKYCEYILRGGTSGKELYFNCRGWGRDFRGPFVIVDGKQRLQAVRSFMDGKIKVFDSYIWEYENQPDLMVARFSWNIAAMETREEVLEWYLNFNAGGGVHTEEELQKVRDMLRQ
ncbi:MAG: DUF262 domain-containing protein [Proteobacteria bacterium]|nr:DUF262 domain-containing protein [Pseudomonadota bacterium]